MIDAKINLLQDWSSLIVNYNKFINLYDHPVLENNHIIGDDWIGLSIKQKEAYNINPIIESSIHCEVRMPDMARDFLEKSLRPLVPAVAIIIHLEHPKLIVTVAHNAWSVTPLFVAALCKEVIINWDAYNIFSDLKDKKLLRPSFDWAANFLSGCDQNNFLSPAKNVSRIPAGYGAQCSTDEVEIFPVHRKSLFLACANLKIDSLSSALSNSLNNIPINELRCGLEVTGGIDSSVIANIYYDMVPDKQLFTYGTIVSEDLGIAQVNRRKAVLDRINCSDKSFYLIRSLDLSQINSFRRATNAILGEPLEGPEQLSASWAANDKVRVLLDGTGADELIHLQLSQKKDEVTRFVRDPVRFAPSFLGESVYGHIKFNNPTQKKIDLRELSIFDTLSKRSSLLISNGIWPHHPFFSPQVIFFINNLPRGLLERKQILRNFLAERNLSQQFSNDYLKESPMGDIKKAIFNQKCYILENICGSCMESRNLINISALKSKYNDLSSGLLPRDFMALFRSFYYSRWLHFLGEY